jgi:hypothetical protein
MARRGTRKKGVAGKTPVVPRRSMRLKKKQNNRDLADLISGMTSMKIESPKKKSVKRTIAGKKASRRTRMSVNRKSRTKKQVNSMMVNASRKPRKYKPASMAEIESLMNKLRM